MLQVCTICQCEKSVEPDGRTSPIKYQMCPVCEHVIKMLGTDRGGWTVATALAEAGSPPHIASILRQA